MGAASLDLLPLELLPFVAEYLTAQETFALSMVTKKLFAALQSRLYSTIDVQFGMETPHPLLQLLRTLLDKPWLAHHISTISLPGPGAFVDHLDVYPDTPVLPKAIILPSERLARLIGAIGVAEDHAWAWFNAIQRLNADDIAAERRRDWHVQSIYLDAVLALVVAISPILVRLSLDTKWATSSHYLGTLVRAFASRKNDQAMDSAVDRDPDFLGLRVTTFQRLRDVAAARVYDTIVETPHTIDTLSWFYFPDNEHLSVSIDNDDTFTWLSSAAPPPSSPTSLEIDRLREPRLSPLLEPLVSLRKLTYNWFCQEDIRHCNTAANLSQLAASISDSCPELEELVMTGEAQPVGAGANSTNPIPSFLDLWQHYQSSKDSGSLLSPLEHLELSNDLEYGGWATEELDEIILSAFSSGGMVNLRSLKEIILFDNGIFDHENAMLSQLSDHYDMSLGFKKRKYMVGIPFRDPVWNFKRLQQLK